MAIAIDLSGHVAVVTGAAGQLGRAIARAMGQAGADVAVHYRTSEEMARRLVEEIGGMGVRATAVRADVTDEASVLAMRDAVAAELGEADILVNNAVSKIPWKSVLEMPVAAFEDQFRSCAVQTVLMAKAFAPAMIAKRYGRIVVTNTECAMQCKPTQAAYAAGKRALDGVVRVLARELGPHQITVNQVAPGWMISDAGRAKGNEDQPGYQATVPLGRRGEDIDIAHAVAFLASDLANFITGTYLPVAGGNVMPGI